MRNIRKYWLLIFVLFGLIVARRVSSAIIGSGYIFHDDSDFWPVIVIIALLLTYHTFKKYLTEKSNNLFQRAVMIIIFYPLLYTIFDVTLSSYDNAITFLLFEEKEHFGIEEVISKTIGANHGTVYMLEFKITSPCFESNREVTTLIFRYDREVYDKYSIGDVDSVSFRSRGHIYYRAHSIGPVQK